MGSSPPRIWGQMIMFSQETLWPFTQELVKQVSCPLPSASARWTPLHENPLLCTGGGFAGLWQQKNLSQMAVEEQLQFPPSVWSTEALEAQPCLGKTPAASRASPVLQGCSNPLDVLWAEFLGWEMNLGHPNLSFTPAHFAWSLLPVPSAEGSELSPPHRALSQLFSGFFLKETPCLLCVVPNPLFFLRGRSGIKPSLFLRCFGIFFPPVFPKAALKLEPARGAVSMSWFPLSPSPCDPTCISTYFPLPLELTERAFEVWQPQGPDKDQMLSVSPRSCPGLGLKGCSWWSLQLDSSWGWLSLLGLAVSKKFHFLLWN